MVSRKEAEKALSRQIKSVQLDGNGTVAVEGQELRDRDTDKEAIRLYEH